MNNVFFFKLSTTFSWLSVFKSSLATLNQRKFYLLCNNNTGQFSRYKQVVGAGRFKTVYRAFDERHGLDVAWSKISAADEREQLSDEQIQRVVTDMSVGLRLEHPNVIRCYECWEDSKAGCINLITEFFTSGNLRDYRRRHKALDVKAVKKWGRQILHGLSYLHQLRPPVVHGDLRPDKIYINGHSGEIKIGDLGLSVLVPKRFAPGVMPEGDPSDQYTEAVDIFAFGLVMLELVTLQKMDRLSSSWIGALESINDPVARDFIESCLKPADERPDATKLLKHPFLAKAPPSATASSSALGAGSGTAGVSASASQSSLGIGRVLSAGSNSLEHMASDRRSADISGSASALLGSEAKTSRTSTDDATARAECEAGSVRGEDYLFQFTGKIRHGKLHFRLHMQYEGDEDEEEGEQLSPRGTSKTIDFVYDPDEDTPDEIAAEISSEFNLSSTDRDICAAALKEWLADQGPDPQR